jgi:hypothetical protein
VSIQQVRNYGTRIEGCVKMMRCHIKKMKTVVPVQSSKDIMIPFVGGLSDFSSVLPVEDAACTTHLRSALRPVSCRVSD